nr:hypothetical protein [Tanacetum cinerariifolium]
TESNSYSSSKRILEKVVKQDGTSQPVPPSDSLRIGTRSSTLDFITSSDSVAGIVSRCSSPILREYTGSFGVTAEHGGSSEILLSFKGLDSSSSSSSS